MDSHSHKTYRFFSFRRSAKLYSRKGLRRAFSRALLLLFCPKRLPSPGSSGRITAPKELSCVQKQEKCSAAERKRTRTPREGKGAALPFRAGLCRARSTRAPRAISVRTAGGSSRVAAPGPRCQRPPALPRRTASPPSSGSVPTAAPSSRGQLRGRPPDRRRRASDRLPGRGARGERRGSPEGGSCAAGRPEGTGPRPQRGPRSRPRARDLPLVSVSSTPDFSRYRRNCSRLESAA